MRSWHPWLVASFLLVPAALVACSSEDPSSASDEDDVTGVKKGALGASCDDVKKQCKSGLVCKEKSTAPPPGAMGMPAPPSTSTSSAPPPGAMGMPIPSTKTCQEPSPGEQGGLCTDKIACDPGLHCVYPSSSGSMPPGAMGMPAPRRGTCEPAHSPPPGAMGMPAPHS